MSENAFFEMLRQYARNARRFGRDFNEAVLAIVFIRAETVARDSGGKITMDEAMAELRGVVGREYPYKLP